MNTIKTVHLKHSENTIGNTLLDLGVNPKSNHEGLGFGALGLEIMKIYPNVKFFFNESLYNLNLASKEDDENTREYRLDIYGIDMITNFVKGGEYNVASWHIGRNENATIGESEYDSDREDTINVYNVNMVNIYTYNSNGISKDLTSLAVNNMLNNGHIDTYMYLSGLDDVVNIKNSCSFTRLVNTARIVVSNTYKYYFKHFTKNAKLVIDDQWLIDVIASWCCAKFNHLLQDAIDYNNGIYVFRKGYCMNKGLLECVINSSSFGSVSDDFYAIAAKKTKVKSRRLVK